MEPGMWEPPTSRGAWPSRLLTTARTVRTFGSRQTTVFHHCSAGMHATMLLLRVTCDDEVAIIDIGI